MSEVTGHVTLITRILVWFLGGVLNTYSWMGIYWGNTHSSDQLPSPAKTKRYMGPCDKDLLNMVQAGMLNKFTKVGGRVAMTDAGLWVL